MVQTKSFSKASGVLYLSVPGVMRRINALEKDLQFPLFDRSNHGVELTHAGLAFYADAKESMRLMHRAVEAGRSKASAEQNRLNIGTTILSQYLRRICMEYNRKSLWHQPLSYTPMETRHGMELLLQRKIDMYLSLSTPSSHPGIRYSLLTTVQPRCLMSTRHPLSAKVPLHLSDLDGEALLFPPPGISHYFDSLRAHVLKICPNVRFVTSDNAISTYMDIEAHQYFCITATLGGIDAPELCCCDIDLEGWTTPIAVYLVHRDEPNKYIEDFICVTRNTVFEESI